MIWGISGQQPVLCFFVSKQHFKNRIVREFPGGAVDKNRLPVQGTQVCSLMWDNCTCCEQLSPCTMITELMLCGSQATADGLVCCSYWRLCVLGPTSCSYWDCVPRACVLQQKKPPQWEDQARQLESGSHSLQLEKAHMQQWRPQTARKINSK